MKQLINFPLEAGDSILIEVHQPDTEAGYGPASRISDVAIEAQQTFEAALSKVKPAVAAIVSQLRDLTVAPDELKVEFGVKMSATAGAILTAAGFEANFTVSVTWKTPRSNQITT